MKIILLLLLVTSAYSSNLDCSRNDSNLDYPNLNWFEASKYTVTSSVQNVNGVLCLGFSDTKKLERVHYFDDLGSEILKTASSLYGKDVIFFSRDLLPGFVRLITRSADPLSLSIKKISKNSYEVNLKFVENMMKGFNRTRIRLIPVKFNFHASKPEFFLEGKEFNEFKLHVANNLRINSISTHLQGQEQTNNYASHYRLTYRKR